MTCLPETIIELYKKSGRTIALAESCTGGLLSARLTSVPGASEVFIGACVSYGNSAKINCLNVNPHTLEAFGAVSAETAMEMARGARGVFKADTALSITGIAGPGGATEVKPVGLVYISLCGSGGAYTQKFEFGGGRDEIRDSAACAALEMLKNALA